ncbi:MAG: SRPBCC domain-containing protein [Streptosporangiales bacterium]|nr:SRPBCC domain-containing protein [Streptosporangiales bacterium]
MSREFEIRKEVVLEATPEQVWQAIATPEGQAAWLFPPEIDKDAAGADADPPNRLAITTPTAPDGSFHAFEYVIEGRDGGTTVLRFVHSGMASDDWGDDLAVMTGYGWDMYLHTLAEYLRHFAGRRATYVSAEAPPSSSAVETWPRLLRALGLGEDVAPGDAVSVRVEGAGPVEGVVDYVQPTFVGVRAADALYRFHGLASMGTPTAVGHHLYADGVDHDAQVKAWEAWLAQVYA